ncbi:FxsA family protein [Gallaecimonas kandeliae]|uniref:FxsA family protein n=1 Tax=Gallaecimonas kandeliae TaxID=3029055 RepID=UPI0026481986|nr:FxsA family protein [Gallaecimonas kandeliae]WKE65029.1 FxsA family protein [Gallaecimonas kandeliae]
MFGRLFLLFLIVPFIEISLLIKLGGIIGVVPTVALMVITAVIGARLVRQAGFATWAEAQRRLAAGEVPGQQICEGLLLLIAGVMLLTPGLLTDLAGIVLLVPSVRGKLAAKLGKRMVVYSAGPMGGQPGQQGHSPRQNNTIEGEFERKD